MFPQLHSLGIDMVKKDDDAVLAAVRKVLEGKGSRRSRLDQWMTKNYAEFTALMEGKRVNWEELTKVFESMGLGEEGKPMGPHTARQTWWKVRRRHGDVRKSRRTKHDVKTESSGLAPGIIREIPDSPSDRKPRVSPVSPASPSVTVGGVRTSAWNDQNDPEGTMRRLEAQMTAGRPNMPKAIK